MQDAPDDVPAGAVGEGGEHPVDVVHVHSYNHVVVRYAGVVATTTPRRESRPGNPIEPTLLSASGLTPRG
ncbi:hypothetical protein CBZ_34530 [Cellulomonas biazotea]|uniref:Uncharacterized protein n=1 Tax=Cellulomonas biazotea TaxID=1709 RepID=A0A402DWA1_9CELL|nr:hypothetical protein CBZ_34530 [Cellulomonas biazotea]